MKLDGLTERNTGLMLPADLDQADGWVPIPICPHRDSSNAEHARLARLEARLREIDPSKLAWHPVRMRHWAVGWIDFAAANVKTAPPAMLTMLKRMKGVTDGQSIE